MVLFVIYFQYLAGSVPYFVRDTVQSLDDSYIEATKYVSGRSGTFLKESEGPIFDKVSEKSMIINNSWSDGDHI